MLRPDPSRRLLTADRPAWFPVACDLRGLRGTTGWRPHQSVRPKYQL